MTYDVYTKSGAESGPFCSCLTPLKRIFGNWRRKDRVEPVARKLLPNLIDEIASKEPGALYAEYPVSLTSYDDGFKSITFAQLARSIDRTAYWLEDSLGRGKCYETVAYLGPNDARYVFAFVGAIKAGYKLLLTSPKNTVAAHVNLLEQLDCKAIIVTDPPLPVVTQILQTRPLKALTIAPLEELMKYTGPRYPYTRTWKEARFDEVFVSHSSGSTGLPQPRIYTNDFIARVARTTLLPPPPGYKSLQRMLRRNRSVVLLPLCHPAGVQFGLLNAVYNRTVVLLPLPAAPPTIDSLIGIIQNTKSNWVIAAPFTLEPLAKDVKLLSEVAKGLDLIVNGGGALPRAIGDIIAEKIKLVNYLGSSETAGYPFLFPRGFDHVKDWSYVQIHPAAGVYFEQRDENSFELVIRRSPMAEQYQPVFEVFPDLVEYATKDMFVPHPRLPDMWTHASRSDDLIIFLNGLKYNPTHFESEVSRHPDIKAVLMFGAQRFESGILVELQGDHDLTVYERAQYIAKIWPWVEAANEDCPSYARVSQAHILLTDPNKPFLWTGKNSLRRQETLKLYGAAIEHLYTDVDLLFEADSNASTQSVDLSDTRAILETIISTARAAGDIDSIRADEDFFQKGLDSVHVLQMTRSLRSALGMPGIHASTLYLNPSPSALTLAILELANNIEHTKCEKLLKRKETMRRILDELQVSIDRQVAAMPSSHLKRKSELPLGHKRAVILTGSTGFIGAYVLRALLESPNVSVVYCLNRHTDSESKQCSRNEKLDGSLPTSFSPERVKFLKADWTKRDLDLDVSLLEVLRSETSLIIHNAWPVDFNRSLQSFIEHLQGVINLGALAARCKHHATLLFLSSIGAVLNYSRSELLPETLIDEAEAAGAAGYSQSKYLAEHLLSYIAPKFNLDVRIARVGQVCGAGRSNGQWKGTEWLPSLITSSYHLGVIPQSLGAYEADSPDVSWLPVDVVADVLLDIGFAPRPSAVSAELYHVINPQSTSWAVLLPHIVSTLDSIPQRKEDGSAATQEPAFTAPNGPRLSAAVQATTQASNGNAIVPGPIPPRPRRSPSSTPMRIVSVVEWLERLRTSAVEAQAMSDAATALAANPALKLLEFYKGSLTTPVLPHWETERAQAVSATLRNASPVSSEQTRLWVRAWCEGRQRA